MLYEHALLVPLKEKVEDISNQYGAKQNNYLSNFKKEEIVFPFMDRKTLCIDLRVQNF